MVGGAWNLSGEPNRRVSPLLQHGLDFATDMYVSDFGHRKSVELYFLLETQGFHALPI